MKKGQVKSVEMLPKVAALMHKTYGPIAMKGAGNMARQQDRFNNSLDKFKDIIFKGGLERGVGAFYGGLAELLVLLKPLAAGLSGIVEGLGDVFYAFRLGVAHIKDFMVTLGLLNFETDEWENDTLETWSNVGQYIGWVLGVLLTKRIFGFIKTLGKIVFGFGEITTAARTLGGITIGGGMFTGFLAMLARVALKLAPIVAGIELINKFNSNQEIMDKEGIDAWQLVERRRQANKVEGEKFTGGITDWFSNAWRGKPSIPTANSMSPTAYYQPQAQMQTQGQYGGMSQPKVDVNVNLNEGALKDLIDIRIDYSTDNILNDINSSYLNK